VHKVLREHKEHRVFLEAHLIQVQQVRKDSQVQQVRKDLQARKDSQVQQARKVFQEVHLIQDQRVQQARKEDYHQLRII
jgi:cellobiose-specific phosphotransferase system component IIA